MKEKLEKRLAELKAEFAKGEATMQELNRRKKELEKTMLRIAGAIQVVEEMLTEEE